MEFLLYLSTQGLDIYNMISKKVLVVENTHICRKHDIYGWYDSNTKTMTLCTDRIKSGPNSTYYINETLYHESVHVAQACKTGNKYLKSFGISLSDMPISNNRKNDIKNAVSIVGESVRHLEHEAFWMEDKPDKVKYVVQKYCF